MRYPLYSLKTGGNNFSYAEYPEDPEKGSFIHIQEDDSEIHIKVDRFSTIPFYFTVHSGRLFGSTKLHLLLGSLSATFQRKLDVQAAIEFLLTNTMIGNKTLLQGINRIPFGHALIFRKDSRQVRFNQYWRLPGTVKQYSEKTAVEALRDSFLQAIRDCVRPFTKVGMHLSGGMDSRQIFGAFLKEKVDFQTFTYGVPQNIDVIVARRVAARFGIQHNYYKWMGVEVFRQKADEHFMLTDGMQALYHGHGIEVHNEQRRLVESVFHGHFLDLLIQAHIHDPFFEVDHGALTSEKLYETFNGGPCSVIKADCVGPAIFQKQFRDVFRESIYNEINNLAYMEPQKRYDSMYFIHHGLRRLLPQVQSGAQFLDFRVPGLHKDFFEVSWSIPGLLRKHRKLQKKLLVSLNKAMMEVPVVRDNVQIEYMGHNFLLKLTSRLELMLRNPQVRVLRPFYSYYGKELRRMADVDLYHWIKKEVLEADLEDHGFINPDYVQFLFKDDRFNPSISDGHYGALFSLSKFISTYIRE